ncbi:thioesterase family protein [Candidatus Chlorohelix sp.]|uniref:acyl-CoA thioesterase n=1 Tax=Candidatus Chlorohelix sp. TaxID=3139201 RepID=UPI00305E7D2D
MKNTIELRVDLGDTDARGVVFYPNYFRWFDRATHELLRAVGLTHSQLLEHYGLAQPVVECGCHFIRPLRYDDIVRIESEVVDLKEKTFKLEHHLFKEGVLVGSGYELRIWIKMEDPDDVGKLKSVSIPEEMAKLLKAK